AALGAPLYRSGVEWTAAARATGMTFSEERPPPPTPSLQGRGLLSSPPPLEGGGWGEGAGRPPAPLLNLPKPSLPGPHQIGNAGIATAAARILGLPGAAIARGIETAAWPARLQRLTGALARRLPPGWSLWLDGGHNPSA